MLGSLRARLIVSFAVVVAMAVFLAGAGALFLLRDEQQSAARERYGRHAEPINDRVAATLQSGGTLADVKAELAQRAEELGIRVLLIDEDLLVVFDSEAEAPAQGSYVLTFENQNLRTTDENGARYKFANWNDTGEKLTLFSSPPRESRGSFETPQYEAYIAIPQSELSSAWLELAPRLALAGAIALAVSLVVSYVISRSISGPLARITQASMQMALGNYDEHNPIRGQDEVGRLSEAFNAMAREVSSSQRMMKDLLANVSHELKTPLTSIQGFSQAILDGAIKSPDELEDSYRIINDEANRMRALVDDLLLLSQIETGQMTMEHKHVDLGALLQRTVERFQWALRDAGIQYGFSADTLLEVHGDERRLEQVFSNLMENAVRHTPQGGAISVSAAAARGGEIRVGIHNTGSYIPPADLPRVFERFFQVDRARARKGGSSGLGLAIVREIVEAHGGGVSAVSDVNVGTEFVIALPSAATAAGLRNGRVPLPEGAGNKRTPRKRAQKSETPAQKHAT